MSGAEPAQPFSITSGSQKLAARLHLCVDQPRARVVIAHGLFSSMASDKLTNLARFLCRAGCLVLQFDHSGCGDSSGDISQTNLSSRRDEFVAAVRALEGEGDAPLIYIGSSMGGTAAAMAADVVPPLCSVLWSAPWDWFELIQNIGDQADAPDLPLMPRDIQGHDLDGVLGRLANACFIHGERDEVVPVAQARRGHQLAREPKDLLIIPGADHRISNPADQQTAFQHTLDWINRFIPA